MRQECFFCIYKEKVTNLVIINPIKNSVKLALLAIGLLLIAIAGMAIKTIFNKGQLEKTCASASRLFEEEGDGTCQFCGATSEDKCKGDQIKIDATLP